MSNRNPVSYWKVLVGQAGELLRLFEKGDVSPMSKNRPREP